MSQVHGHVAEHNGRPTLFINDVPVLPMMYALTDSPGGRWSWEEVPQWNIRNFSEQGIRLFYVDIWLEYIWFTDQPLNIDLVRRQIRGVLDVCPDAAVCIRLHVNSPPWWNETHPDECVEYANGPVEPTRIWGLHRPLEGDLDRSPRHSMASSLWMEEAGARVAELCERLAQTPEGDRLFGLHLAAGVFHEWHYYGFIEHEPDTGAAMTAYFRRWLEATYGDDQTLGRAWNNPAVTLATAAVPGMAERYHTSEGYFRDPERERQVIDYFQCHQHSVAEAAIHFCRVAKEHWPRPLVTGTFYGYFYTMFGRMVTGGHLCNAEVLRSPYVDFLSAPQSYQHRQLGGSGQSRGLLTSVRLHNKLWLDEMDYQPFIFNWSATSREVSITNELRDNPEYQHALTTSIGVLRRSVAQPLFEGMGLWFYDFGPKNTSGWWDHPVLLAEIKRLHAFFTPYIEQPFETLADVLLVYDTAVFYYLGHNKEIDPVTPVLIDETSRDLYRSGVRFDTIYLDDLARVNLRRYKVVIFANTFAMRAEQRQYIRENVARDGRHLIWMCAPGYTDGERLDVALVSELTGIAVRRLAWTDAPEIVVEQGEQPTMRYGMTVPVQPLFVVDDTAATACGQLLGSDAIALASKELGDSTVWFSSVPLRGPALLRWLCGTGEAHVYQEDNDVVYSGNGMLCLHAATAGTKTIRLRNGTVCQVNLQLGDTVLLHNESGEVLLQ